MPSKRPAPLLPATDHIAYLANLITVLAALYAAYYIWRRDHATPDEHAYGPREWRAG